MTSELDSGGISKVFERVCALGIAMGWENINSQPGCVEHQVDPQWWFAINPHGEPTECSSGAKVPAYAIYLQFNGWPAGVVTANGGLMAAGGLANEERLIDALNVAIEKVEK